MVLYYFTIGTHDVSLAAQVNDLESQVASAEKKSEMSSKREKQRHTMNQELNAQHDETIEHLHDVEAQRAIPQPR